MKGLTFILELKVNGVLAWSGPVTVNKETSTLHVDLPVVVVPAGSKEVQHGTSPAKPPVESSEDQNAERVELQR